MKERNEEKTEAARSPTPTTNREARRKRNGMEYGTKDMGEFFFVEEKQAEFANHVGVAFI
jgi:hypothetical protein